MLKNPEEACIEASYSPETTRKEPLYNLGLKETFVYP